MGGFRRTGEREVHQGHIWRVAVATFADPDGGEFERDVVRSPGAVAVLPVRFDAEGQALVTLVRQYRPVFDSEIIEVPAGMRDVPGEPDERTARRELAEEVGLAAEDVVHLGDILPSPGMTDAVTTLYLATGLSEVGRNAQGPEEDHMEVLHMPLSAALDMVDAGEIRDAKTVTSLLLLARRLAAGDRGP